MMNKLTIALLAALAITGCAATTPTPLSQVKDAPLERVLEYQTQLDQEAATIVVTRDIGYAGSACYFALWIDGKLAARLNAGETSRFFVSPGEHVLRYGPDPFGKGLCGRGNPPTQRETILKPKETKQFRLLFVDSFADIQRTDP